MHVGGFVRGKGRFVVTEFVPTTERTNRSFPLILTTGRILSQYNVGAQTRRTDNVTWHTEDLLDIHPHDAEVRGIKELSIVGLPQGDGSERVACLAVYAAGPDDEAAADRAERRERASKHLREAFERLPRVAKPTVVHLIDAYLPRTATRKVKRSEVRQHLARIVEATTELAPSQGTGTVVRHALARLTGRAERELAATTSLRGELGIDSLLSVELTAALESAVGATIDGKELSRCETVADLEALVERASRGDLAKREGAASAIVDDGDEPLPKVPEPIAEAVKNGIGQLQTAFYGKLMRPTVYGRAHVPHNRNAIVVSNHASHLDMGFVRYALGTWGDDLVSLAAQDYFFDGDKWRRAWFENFTNLAPFDRKGGLKQSLRVAGEHLDAGRNVLIFPEGTRTPDGSIQEFKPAIGHLALVHGVDILPVYLGGTYEAMKKGSKLPTKRELVARIGKPLEVAELKRLTAGMKATAAYRKVAELAERAVRLLEQGKILDLRDLDAGGANTASAPVLEEPPLVRLFRELEGRLVPARVDKPITYYFTLGASDDAKWTLKVDKGGAKASRGKPEGGQADCVLKTSPDLFTRIVKEAYTPSPMEFLSGAIKSNDISLLQTFQKVFDLS
jgi:long-chain acyl-CoA synthetase